LASDRTEKLKSRENSPRATSSWRHFNRPGGGVCQNISLYEPEQSLSLSQDEREGAEVYPKQSSLERSF